MSLINQMLKDLEQRRAEQVIAEPLAGVSSSVVVKQGSPVNYLLLGAVIALAVLSAALLVMQGQRKTESVEVKLPEPARAVEQAAKPVKVETIAPVVTRVVTTSRAAKAETPMVQPAPVQAQPVAAAAAQEIPEQQHAMESPVRLLAVQVRHAGARSRLLLELERKTEYQAALEDQLLTVRLAHVNAGDMETGDERITLVDQAQADGQLVLKFELATAYELRGMAMAPHVVDSQGEGARLSIELAAVEEAAPEAAPADAMAKRVRPLTPTQQAQVMFQQAVTQLGRGNTAQAQALLRSALEQDLAHVQARETYAALMLNTGRLSEAEGLLAQGLQHNPKASALAKLYARIIAGRGQEAQAIQVLERAVPNMESDPDYAAMLAALYQRQQRHGEAAQIYGVLVRLRPAMAPWWMGFGLSLEAMGDNEQAAKAYAQSLRLGGLDKQVSDYVMQRLQALNITAVSSKASQAALPTPHRTEEE